MGIIGIHHVQINSSDVERSRSFYEKVMGGRIVCRIMEKDGSALKGYMIQIAEKCILEIQPPRFRETGTVSAWKALALETDDIYTIIKRTKENGGICETEPLQKQEDKLKYLYAVIKGPDNEQLELVQWL